jgi:hypothetical protein
MNGNRRCGDHRNVVLQQRLDAIQPARAPTKYQLTTNLKTAKALGLTVPSLLLRTAEVMKMSPTSGIGTERTCRGGSPMSAIKGINRPGSDAARGPGLTPKRKSNDAKAALNRDRCTVRRFHRHARRRPIRNRS